MKPNGRDCYDVVLSLWLRFSVGITLPWMHLNCRFWSARETMVFLFFCTSALFQAVWFYACLPVGHKGRGVMPLGLCLLLSRGGGGCPAHSSALTPRVKTSYVYSADYRRGKLFIP